jgi:hypothetical protein
MFNLRKKAGKIIVSFNEREFAFYTLIGALRFIKYMSEDQKDGLHT